jgi:hypothetical protein
MGRRSSRANRIPSYDVTMMPASLLAICCTISLPSRPTLPHQYSLTLPQVSLNSLRCHSSPSDVTQVHQVSLKSLRCPSVPQVSLGPSGVTQVHEVSLKSLRCHSSPSGVNQVPQVLLKSLRCHSSPPQVSTAPALLLATCCNNLVPLSASPCQQRWCCKRKNRWVCGIGGGV